jgi:hypothetical protein
MRFARKGVVWCVRKLPELAVGVNQYVPPKCSNKILEPQDGAILSRVCASETHEQLLASSHANK